MSTLTDSEIEELRIAIAESVGWTDCRIAHPPSLLLTGSPPKPDHPNHREPVPEFTTSLDAIQQAAMERFISYEDSFSSNLASMTYESEYAFVWQLTPLDWCIAFARTARIWRFKP